jgi:hypothetical protein
MYVVKDFNTQARYSEQRRSARLPKNGLLTMEHVLEFKSDAVFNLLIDQAGMDRTVLVETQSQGVQLVFKSGMPNIKEAFTQDGTKVFKKGQSQTILQNKNRQVMASGCVIMTHYRLPALISAISTVIVTQPLAVTRLFISSRFNRK